MFVLKHAVNPLLKSVSFYCSYLEHVFAHSLFKVVKKRFVFKFELNIVVITVWDLVHEEVNLYGTLRDRLFLFGFAEFDPVASDKVIRRCLT